MARPSIFSKDYEKLMKKRRRRIVITILSILLIGTGTTLYVYNGGVDFTKIKHSLQAWVDSGENPVEEESVLTGTPEVKEEVEETPKEEFFETIVDEKELKVYLNTAEDGTKTFNQVVVGENVSISPDKTKLLVKDSKQNMLIINLNDERTDITKPDYVSTTGSVFAKDNILNQFNGYLWHENPKFISDTKVAYVSNLPYFGVGINEYMWIFDLESGQHVTKWEVVGNKISLGEISEKGLEINVDGKIKYVTVDGNIVY